jgi:ADP-heptose:LPS heptosyltransferase
MASWRGHFLESFELDEQASRFREIGKRCLWRAQNPDLHSRETDSLIKEAIHAFLGLFFVQRRYLKEAIQTLLCLLGHSDKHIQSKALEGLFKLVVERLNDSFNPEYGALYNHLFAELIDFCRKERNGSALDEKLKAFHIFSSSDLFFRKEFLKTSTSFSQKKPLKKILVLSRVTLGADVAITSILLKRFHQHFPEAKILLVASEKATELFGGAFEVLPLSYQRQGSLTDRLSSWIDAVSLIEKELQGLDPEEYLVLDPDSRITQLGLLPLLKEERRYFFFESRTFGGQGDHSLGFLANRWLNLLLSQEEETFPEVFLLNEDKKRGKFFADQVQDLGFQSTLSMNLGVGGNALKRVPHPDFEKKLVLTLLEQGFFLYLDQGIGEELERTSAILSFLESKGFKVQRLNASEEQGSFTLAPQTQILAWNGGIGGFASFIQHSQGYIGYDSACQHIAAAQKVPVLDIFAGFTHPQMTKRWKPYGNTPVELLILDTLHLQKEIDLDSLLQQVLTLLRKLVTFPKT